MPRAFGSDSFCKRSPSSYSGSPSPERRAGSPTNEEQSLPNNSAKFDDAQIDGQSHKRQFTRAVQRSSTRDGRSFKVGDDLEVHDSSVAHGKQINTLMRGESSFNVNFKEQEERKKQIQAQSERYRKQIKSRKRFSFDPHSKAVQRWDVLTSLALLFTATVTPFEVGIVDPSPLDVMITQPLFWINRAVDSIFITDSVLQRFQPREAPPVPMPCQLQQTLLLPLL